MSPHYYKLYYRCSLQMNLMQEATNEDCASIQLGTKTKMKYLNLLGIQNKYFSTKGWWENRYHAMNTIFGHTKFIDLNTFTNPMNGYLSYDSYIFGILSSAQMDIEEAKGIAFQYFCQSSFPVDTNVFVKFILRIKDQKHGKHIEFKDDHLFAPNDTDRGWDWFLSFADLEDPKQGFLVDGTLVIEAEVKLL
ncbi:hypothetical protein Q3G72_000574 [Acer saccharum]|nr:hypothetical protein Q3G72_000574 [Acer saccharum]